MRYYWQYLWLMVATFSLGAGEYSDWSPGFEITASRSTASQRKVDGNANVDNLFGVGLTSQLRLGELCSWNLNSLVVVPTIGLMAGALSDSSNRANLDYLHSDGRVERVSGTKSHSKTKLYELTLIAPLRWYFMTKNAAYGGAFVEAGPLICRAQHKNDLQVTGMSLDKQFVNTKTQRYTTTNYGLAAGIGKTNIYDEHQFTYGLSLHAINSASDIKSKNKVQYRVNIQTSWTF